MNRALNPPSWWWSGVLVVLSATALAQQNPAPTVGMTGRVRELVLPGPEVVVKPADLAAKVVVRIVSVRPHGSAFRYDLEFQGFEPGRYDLRDVLVRKDGSALGTLPEIPVEVKDERAPGLVLPNPLGQGATAKVGGYETWLVLIGVAWFVGLLAIIFVARKKRAEAICRRPKPMTLAERLRPLVLSAISGRIDPLDRAGLELGLVALWRRRLCLEGKPPGEILPLIREHAEAGPLLRGLEEWLHAPGTPEGVDVGRLLAPYEHLDATEWDVARAAGS